MSEPRLVTISSGALTARINPLGAELWSLADAQGREYMTNADPAFWAGHAPLLFPIVGRLNGDVLRVDGRAHAMKQHGFARRLEWELVGAGADAVTFRLADSAATRESYPFPFEIAVLYALEEATLSTVVRVGNPGAAALPFSFGFHPAFAWPLPGGGDKAGHRIEFECGEPQTIRRLDAAGLLAGREASPIAGNTLALDPALFERDAMVWDELTSRRLSYVSPEGVRLDIAFPDMAMLGLWQKPGADFLCIEPWAGLADPAGFVGELAEKPGIVLLPAGAERRFRMDVTVRGG